MKKSAFLVIILLLTGSLRAQQYEKNILGVRGGLNLAYIHAEGNTSGNTSPRAGYHLGVSDQILLCSKLPLYIETGVTFSSRGGKFEGISFRPMYIQIPLLVNYRFDLGKRVAIQPFVGIYYGLGIGGKGRHDDGWADIFGERGMLRRSDLGTRMGIGVVVKRIWLSVGFDLGRLDNLAPGYSGWQPDTESRYSYDFDRLTTNSFTLSIGYNF